MSTDIEAWAEQNRATLGTAARAIRSDWERETWDPRSHTYNVAVSNLLLHVALGDIAKVEAAALDVARAYLSGEESA